MSSVTDVVSVLLNEPLTWYYTRVGPGVYDKRRGVYDKRRVIGECPELEVVLECDSLFELTVLAKEYIDDWLRTRVTKQDFEDTVERLGIKLPPKENVNSSIQLTASMEFIEEDNDEFLHKGREE